MGANARDALLQLQPKLPSCGDIQTPRGSQDDNLLTIVRCVRSLIHGVQFLDNSNNLSNVCSKH